jgi:hypothetical protein
MLMKKINLAESFEQLWSAISSLPLTNDGSSQRMEEDSKRIKVKQLLREIHEAANGRHVATTIGLVAIAPPIAPHLKDKPFFVESQADFLAQALARLAPDASKQSALSAPTARLVGQLRSPPVERNMPAH